MSRVAGRGVRVEERGSRDGTHTHIQGSVTQRVVGVSLHSFLVFFFRGHLGCSIIESA
jgi:hypothetical protein